MRKLISSFALALLLAAAAALAGDIPGEVVLVGVDHQIYVVNPNRGEPRALTRGEAGRMAGGSVNLAAARFAAGDESPPGEQRYSWPTWAPDGQSLLVHGARVSGAGVLERAGVYHVSLSRPGAIRPLFEHPRKTPIYAYWAPAGQRAAVLVTDPGGLALSIIDIASGDLSALAVGLPFYFAWREDGKAMVTHVGGAGSDDQPAEVSLIDLSRASKDRPAEITRVSDRPVAFRAPAWSPDGTQFAYARRREGMGGASLILVSGESGKSRELATISSRSVFSWLPDGQAIAVAEAAAPDTPLFAGISSIRVTDGSRDPLFAGPVGAFFVSPDGTRLLVAAPDFDSGEWSWIVVERSTRQAREVARFLPSPDFQMLALHFDQFALSHRLWAPDSRHFVFSAYPAPRTAEAAAEPVPPAVRIVDTKTGEARRLGDGREAFWSPR